MQELIDMLNIVFTPGRTAIIIAGLIPMFFGLFRMVTADGNPRQHHNGRHTFILGGFFACAVFTCVVTYAHFTNHVI